MIKPSIRTVKPSSVTPVGSDHTEKIALAGREGEEALAKWFSDNNLGYVAICQHPDTFSTIFTDAVKRPDFLLLFDSLGLIAVDAKNLSVYKPKKIEYYSLPLDEELKKAVAFERIFRLPIWYAVKGDGKWYWISALKAIEVGYNQTSEQGNNFVNIKVADFVSVAVGSDLSKLYGQRMPSYKSVASTK